MLILIQDALLRPAPRKGLFEIPSLLLFGLALLAVVAPWIGSLVEQQHWDSLQGFLGFSNLERATKAVDGHDQPLFFYGPLLIGLILSARLGATGQYGRELLSHPGGSRLAALAVSMLLLVFCLSTLATPYRTMQQEPVQHLARAAQTLKGSAQVRSMMGSPRYSVVALADTPTILGSPGKSARERPTVSGYRNWLEHRNDREALVLGACRLVTALAEEQGPEIRMLERQGNDCLAPFQRMVVHG